MNFERVTVVEESPPYPPPGNQSITGITSYIYTDNYALIILTIEPFLFVDQVIQLRLQAIKVMTMVLLHHHHHLLTRMPAAMGVVLS